MKKLVLVALALTLLNACATMSESDCRQADWRNIGEKDALEGHKKDRFNEHASACNEYGLPVDRNAYNSGWAEGIKQFCTRDNGWLYGVKGSSYQNTCPGELKVVFFNAFQQGRNVFEKKQAVAILQSELNGVRDDLEDDKLSKEDRKRLKKDKKRLNYKIFSAEQDEHSAIEEARQMGFPAY